MKLARIAAICLCIFALLAPLASVSGAAPEETDGKKKAAPTLPPGGSAKRGILFPGLESSLITAVSVLTPERSFEFRCDPAKDVSVNGHLADEEIFCTLISQIEELPVDDVHSFAAENTLLLTLVISTTGGTQHTARFYDDGGAGTQAFIASGPAESPVYHQTDAWRVGTLMMTCEGTRIQDERGNETPVD